MTACLSVVFTAALIWAGLAVAQSSDRPGTVHRGMMEGGIWVELAQDGSGRAELVILDGLPGGTPEPLFTPLQRQGGEPCLLQSANQAISVTPCPGPTTAQVTIRLGGASGRANLQSVGWDGSIAWGDGSSDRLSRVTDSCRLPQLVAFQPIAGSPFGTAVRRLSAETATLATSGSGNGPTLQQLRTDRLRAYSVIALTPAEAERARAVDDAVAGRPVNGRLVPLPEATRMRQDFERTVVNSPARAQARIDLLQADRALAQIYDPAATARTQQSLQRVREQAGTGILGELNQTLDARLPASIMDLLLLEQHASEIDSCRAALGFPGQARPAVRAALIRRSGELSDMIMAGVSSAGSSGAARTFLQPFEGNPAVRDILQASGRSSVLTEARARITRMADAEEQAQRDAARQASAQAARDAVPPTAAGGRFQVARVRDSVVFVLGRGRSGLGRGSGFLVAPGIVVTNHHVAAGNSELYVIANNGRMRDARPARLIATYPIHDIAVLRVDGMTGQTVPLLGEDPPQGAQIWALGFPGIADDVLVRDSMSIEVASLSEGIVTRVIDGFAETSNRAGTTRLVQHTANTARGNSGGPIFDNCHRVVAVHAAAPFDETRAARVPTAIASRLLPELLRQAGVTPRVVRGAC